MTVTGLSIDCWNTGAAVATTPTLLQWFVYWNGSAASLVSNPQNRLAVGSQTFAVGAAIGGNPDRQILRPFSAPLITQANRFFGIGLRIPVGTATASQVIAGMIGVEGFFE